MNLRKWSKAHSLGLSVGIVSPLVFTPLVILILSQVQNYTFSYLWHQFTVINVMQSKMVSLAILSNLAWFYLSLNKTNYNFAMGILVGSMIYIPYVVYNNYFA
jgi:hypothetical protein